MTTTLANIDELVRCLPKPMHRVLTARVDAPGSFVEIVDRFADETGTIGLLSGGTLDSARYHILGIRPWLSVRERGGNVVVDFAGGSLSAELDPFAVLDALLKRYALPGPEAEPPLSAGLLGYLAYDLKDCLEVLPRTSRDDLGLPRVYMVAPSILVVHDRREATTKVHVPVFEGGEEVARRRLAEFEEELLRGSPPARDAQARVGSIRSGLSRNEYIEAVEAIRDYIVRGHVYQVNMSQRFETEFSGDAFALFSHLYKANPAPFFAFIQAGDHQIVSTSPERFIQLSGKAVETRPIKGTRPRGQTPEQDQALRHELETSFKDDAELSMIVDLLRNDIGKACAAGSVHVIEHKRVEAYENVYHLVSVVRGELDEGQNAVDLIRATFPGGSITGCPKIRSMEIIDELEPVRRHIYTGSIGYLGFSGTMDLSIAIRTATLAGGRLVFSVGGGCVFDSDPSDEFDETLHKGRTLMNALERRGAPDEPGKAAAKPRPGGDRRIGWCNGKFKSLSDITVSVEDEGFAYGYGFFETIRVNSGHPLRLDAHLARFRRAWEYCFGRAVFPDITWRDVIDQVIAKNDLGAKTAVVKILAAAGKPGEGAGGVSLIATAREYKHRLEATGRKGLKLATYPHSRESHLAAHKTMNYMFQRMAAEWARGREADEALILNGDGSVSETNTANLFCEIGGTVFQPLSEHVLPGTMEQAVCAQMAQWGTAVERRRLTVAELKNATWVMVTNALMGAVPVTHLDGVPLRNDAGICARLNEALLE